VATAVAVLIAGCGFDGDPAGEVADDVPRATGVVRAVSVRPSEHSVLAFEATLTAEEEVSVGARATSTDGHVVEMPATAARRTEHRYPLVGLRAESEYEVVFTTRGRNGDPVGEGRTRVTTGALPQDLPALEVVQAEPARMADGLTMFDVGQWGVDDNRRTEAALIVLDDEGEVVWYRQSPFAIGDARLTGDGAILVNYPDFAAQEMDLMGEPILSWELEGRPEPGRVLVGRDQGGYGGIHHEVNPVPNGNILTLMRNRTPLSDDERARYCPGDPEPFDLREDLVVEFERDGAIANEWSLRDVIDPAVLPGTDLCLPSSVRDWAHANGAILDEDRNAVIVTARHLDLLLAFRYRDDGAGPSGELLWSLGPGGTLPLVEGEPAYHLHAPELQEDGSILLYDNGNGRPGTSPDDPVAPTYSRAVRYEIDDSAPDPAQWSARQVWEHRVDDRDGTPLYADFLADADTLANGNVLIDHGGIGQEQPPSRGRLIEVVPEAPAGGPIVFDVWLPDGWVSYRAERIPSLYAGPAWVGD
jgi:hypothetical protein